MLIYGRCQRRCSVGAARRRASEWCGVSAGASLMDTPVPAGSVSRFAAIPPVPDGSGSRCRTVLRDRRRHGGRGAAEGPEAYVPPGCGRPEARRQSDCAWACAASFRLTEPSSIPVNPPCPRVPVSSVRGVLRNRDEGPEFLYGCHCDTAFGWRTTRLPQGTMRGTGVHHFARRLSGRLCTGRSATGPKGPGSAESPSRSLLGSSTSLSSGFSAIARSRRSAGIPLARRQ